MKEISSLQHRLVKHWVKLQKSRSYRYEQGRVVVEGKKLVKELSHALYVVTTSENLIPKSIQTEEVVIVSDVVMKKISCLEKPEGIFAEVSMPEERNLKGCSRILGLDGVSDPGNVGTLVRTALALKWDGIFFFEGCCDPFNDKVIRASKGAIFQLPIARGNWRKLEKFLSLETPKWAAALEGVSPDTIPFQESCLLIVGSEAHGLSKTTEKKCQRVSIAMKEGVDSLNVAVAGGILMYEL